MASSRSRTLLVAVVGLALAGASLPVVAPAPSYDPWMWLLWGREVASGTLSTAGGPAFKPLPVAVCALLAPLGDAAPVAWVVLARAAAAAAVWLAFVLGRDLAGGSTPAGVLAAAGVALCGAFPRYATAGDVTGLFVALALGAVLAWRAGSPRGALACAAGCALLRPEAWPFGLAAAGVAWRRAPALRPALAALAVAVPVAWLVPEWLGSGDLLRSGVRARVPNPGQPALADVPALASLQAAAGLALWPLLVGAALLAWRPAGATAARWLAAAGLAWMLLVAAMAQAGFSGEPRYALPGVALLAVAGAAGLAAAWRAHPLAAGTAVVLVALTAVPRVLDLPAVRAAQEHQWRLAQGLDAAIAAAGGRTAVLACGTPFAGRFRGPLVAYRLRVPKARVAAGAPPRPPGVVFGSRLTAGAPVTPSAGGFRAVATSGPWAVRAACAGREELGLPKLPGRAAAASPARHPPDARRRARRLR